MAAEPGPQDNCLWCAEPIGRAAAVEDKAQPGLAAWHKRCWSPWVKAQEFKRGRRPEAQPVTP